MALCLVSVSLWTGFVTEHLFNEVARFVETISSHATPARLQQMRSGLKSTDSFLSELPSGIILVQDTRRQIPEWMSLLDNLGQGNDLMGILQIVKWTFLVGTILLWLQVLYSSLKLTADAVVHPEARESWLASGLILVLLNGLVFFLLITLVWNPFRP